MVKIYKNRLKLGIHGIKKQVKSKSLVDLSCPTSTTKKRNYVKIGNTASCLA